MEVAIKGEGVSCKRAVETWKRLAGSISKRVEMWAAEGGWRGVCGNVEMAEYSTGKSVEMWQDLENAGRAPNTTDKNAVVAKYHHRRYFKHVKYIGIVICSVTETRKARMFVYLDLINVCGNVEEWGWPTCKRVEMWRIAVRG